MTRLPSHYTKFMEGYPQIGAAYRAMGDAVADSGPLDAKTRELVKLGIAIGARLETGVRSHTRKALEAGATPEELRHAVLQALTTAGFPTMMTGMSLVDSVIDAQPSEN